MFCPASVFVFTAELIFRLINLILRGRVVPETRSIQCSYHGWTFDGASGACQHIPQASDTIETAAIKNPKSCVPSHR